MIILEMLDFRQYIGEGNEFYNTVIQPTPLVAIYTQNETGITNMKISKNKIHNLTTTAADLFGILLYDAVRTVDNNMISCNFASDNWYRPGNRSRCCHQNYNNTVYITGTTSNDSFALFKNWFSTGDDFRNNILINTRLNNSEQGQYAFVSLNTGSFTSNYNDLVSIGTLIIMGHINTVVLFIIQHWPSGRQASQMLIPSV
jgi:hypothetical protein